MTREGVINFEASLQKFPTVTQSILINIPPQIPMRELRGNIVP
jgi:hypothetical protein